MRALLPQEHGWIALSFPIPLILLPGQLLSTLHLSYGSAHVYVLFLCYLPSVPATHPLFVYSRVLGLLSPFWHSNLAFLHLPGLHLFLSLIWVLSFLSSVFRGKMGQTSISASQIIFSLLGLHLWTTYICLYLVPTLLLATCLGCCLSFMCDSSTLAEVTLLFPPPQYDVASLGHFSFSLQHQELSSWEAIYGSPAPSTVCSLLSIKRRAEHSVFWALRVTGLPPPQHCGCLSIHAMHLSLRRPEPPLTCLVLLSVCLEQICSCQFPALPSCPFSVSFHHLSQEPKRRKEEREVHNCRIRLIRFRLHPFCLLHGVCLSIWCGARWG